MRTHNCNCMHHGTYGAANDMAQSGPHKEAYRFHIRAEKRHMRRLSQFSQVPLHSPPILLAAMECLAMAPAAFHRKPHRERV
jgi:hypothetical protein